MLFGVLALDVQLNNTFWILTALSDFIRNLSDLGIGTQVHYIPIHKQPYWVSIQKECSLPGAEKYYEGCLSLPLFPKMSSSDVEYVIDKLVIIFDKEFQ